MTPSTPTAATKSDQEARPFDPQAPCVGSDGLEYADFAALLLGEPLVCNRNVAIRVSKEYDPPGSWRRVVWDHHHEYDRDGNPRVAGSAIKHIEGLAAFGPNRRPPA